MLIIYIKYCSCNLDRKEAWHHVEPPKRTTSKMDCVQSKSLEVRGNHIGYRIRSVDNHPVNIGMVVVCIREVR